MDDGIDALEVLHKEGDQDLHFRFFGMAMDRQFIVNIQFASSSEKAVECLMPVERDFLITKILELVLERVTKTPTPGLH